MKKFSIWLMCLLLTACGSLPTQTIVATFEGRNEEMLFTQTANYF